MTLTVIVAAHDEEATIAQVVRELRSLPEAPAIIVVDDGSRDGTPTALRSVAGPDLTVITQATNRGKGAAVRAGIAAATGEIIALHDADLELSAEPIGAMARLIDEGRADAVFGYRFGKGSGASRACRVGNACLTAAANRLYGAGLADISCGQKAFRGELLRSLPLSAEGFELEAELTALTLRSGGRIVETAVPYSPRGRAEGKKVRYLRDGWRSLATLMRLRRRPMGGAPEEERVLP